jgi:large subunit ribosomal protein L10Ae
MFWGANRLPNVPRPRMSICILADAADIDRAKQIDLEYMSVDDLKKYVSRPIICLLLIAYTYR